MVEMILEKTLTHQHLTLTAQKPRIILFVFILAVILLSLRGAVEVEEWFG